MPVLEQIDPLSYLGRDLNGPAYITSMSDVEESICTPPCECTDCQHGFYTSQEQLNPPFWYQGKLSDQDAERICVRYIQDAESDRQYLLSRLASHADIIVNRWKKKHREKREALLLETIPELCEDRWLIPRYCYMPESKLVGMGGRTWTRRCQLLLHWMSVDVLKTNPTVLFALLHNRTTYTSQDWQAFDTMQLILSWATGHFDVEYSPKCVFMYGAGYGKLVDWQAGPAHRSDIIGFPKARLVLEAQAYLLGALRKITDKILEGVDFDKPGSSEKWKTMTMLGFRHANEVELWSPYTNQAFSAPPVFSIDALISIAQTRLEAMGDHLWFLQTDSAYMRRWIKVISQGEFYKAIKKEAAGAIIATEIFSYVASYWRWSWIKSECEYVKSIHDRFRDSIRPGAPLPCLYDRALGSLELFLVNEVLKRGTHLGQAMPQRPGFSRNWNVKWKPDLGPTLFQVDRKAGTPVEQKDIFEKDPLEWCLIQLQANPDTQTNYDHALLFSFLESHLARSSPKEKARVDEVLYQNLSDLAACHEMLVSVRLHRPQNKARELDEVQTSEKRIAWKGWKIEGYLTQDNINNLGKALLRDFFDAPLPYGQKNATWFARSKSIRKALEAFWAGLRTGPKVAFDFWGFTAEETRESLQAISANLSQEYLDMVRAEEQEILSGIERARVPEAVPVQKEWAPSSPEESTCTSPQTKQKTKTRPTEQTSTIEEASRGIAGITVDEQVKIEVSKRASSMLALMFPTNATESGKSLEWDLFVHAMSDMGFSARNAGGSAVVFENCHLANGRANAGKIIFHKPHPASKIDPVMLHSIGTRMSKWFGWQRQRFALE